MCSIGVIGSGFALVVGLSVNLVVVDPSPVGPVVDLGLVVKSVDDTSLVVNPEPDLEVV